MRHLDYTRIIVSHCIHSICELLSLIHDIIMCNLFECVQFDDEKPGEEKKEKGEGGAENARRGRETLRHLLENSPKNLFLNKIDVFIN